jgi:imidazole glycerol phosphate synthase glutamine amidotransferase subunit
MVCEFRILIDVGVVNCGISNFRSVAHALRVLEVEVAEINTGNDLRTGCTHLVLPGVGTFPELARRLDQTGLSSTIKERAKKGDIRILGICLGMQMLFESSEEYKGEMPGLALLKGSCTRLEEGENVSVPHIGWNEVENTGETRLLKGLERVEEFYFLHSYHVCPDDRSIVTSVSTHGRKFPAVIESGLIFGTQFHPEKSYKKGLHVLRNFVEFT